MTLMIPIANTSTPLMQ